MPKTPVTQQDIAKKLGISPISVSYALKGSKNVSAKTRERVAKAAAEMGYRVNRSAQSMRTGQTHMFGLLLGFGPGISTLPAPLLGGLCTEMHHAQRHLVLARFTDEELTDPQSYPTILKEHVVDGLLVNFTHKAPERMDDVFEELELPAVWLNNKRPFSAVYHDDHMVGVKAVELLLLEGRQRIIYFDTAVAALAPDQHYSRQDRREGYLSAMKRARLEPRLEGPSFSKSAMARSDGQSLLLVEKQQAMRAILEENPRPDGFLCFHNDDALVLSLVAREMGVRIGSDIKIVSAGTGTSSGVPQLHVIRLDYAFMARQAVQMLISKVMEPGGEPLKSIAVPPVVG